MFFNDPWERRKKVLKALEALQTSSANESGRLAYSKKATLSSGVSFFERIFVFISLSVDQNFRISVQQPSIVTRDGMCGSVSRVLVILCVFSLD